MALPASPDDAEAFATRDEFLRFQMVGCAPAFRAALRLIERVAQCDAAALIPGETGTGKELAAGAIHYLGARADQMGTRLLDRST